MLALLVPGAEAANRIYWSSFDGGKISYWNLDNSGGANIDTSGATVDGPMGMALDPAIAGSIGPTGAVKGLGSRASALERRSPMPISAAAAAARFRSLPLT